MNINNFKTYQIINIVLPLNNFIYNNIEIPWSFKDFIYFVLSVLFLIFYENSNFYFSDKMLTNKFPTTIKREYVIKRASVGVQTRREKTIEYQFIINHVEVWTNNLTTHPIYSTSNELGMVHKMKSLNLVQKMKEIK